MGELLGRPLTHAIRYVLDVRLPRDVLALEARRHTEHEYLLSALRMRVSEIQPREWSALRQLAPSVWSVLARQRMLA